MPEYRWKPFYVVCPSHLCSTDVTTETICPPTI